MADTKITDLTAITSGVASTDVTVLVDVSDTSMAASGTDKKITVGDLATAITSAGSLATDAEVASAISALSTVYQPLDSDLTAIAALSTTSFGRSLLALADAAAGRTALGLGTIATQAASGVSITGGSVTGITDLAVADGGTGASDAATARTNLGLVIGTDVAAQSSLASYQPLDSDLTAIAALTTTTFGRSLLALADAAAGRTALGLVIGTDVQAQDAELAAIAGLTSAADRLPYFTGSGTASLATFTAAGRALVDDADASAQRTTLGLAAIASSGSASDLSAGTVATARLGSGTADSSTFLRGDQTWATPAGGGSSGTLSQRGQMTAYDATASFYGVPSFAITTANTTLTLVADTLYYFLFFVDSDITINTAALEVTTAAGTTIRHGIVRLDASDRQPNSTGLIWQTTASSASTGFKTSSSLSIALTAGIYASLVVCDGAAAIRRARGALASTMFRFNATNAAVALTSKPSVGTSAFSDPVPDWTAITVADIVDQPVGYRWS